MEIEMTGAEDRQGPWKLALCGPPGVGKTMFASTARSPLFVFFQQEPRIKSIANRSVPNVKLVNNFTSGLLALDQLQALIMYLKMTDHPYDTFVVDTGDELFQAMKAGRAFQNGGEFNVGDWGWIGDMYREVMLAIIDLPMNVIVNFHTKLTNDGEDMYRELMLQGQAKDEAPGWFDIVGALDTFEVVDEQGQNITRRVLLTSSSRLYPWVKDHSGALPRRFYLSDGITDDFPRLLEVVSQTLDVHPKEVIGEVPIIPAPKPQTPAGIPSQEDLLHKKEEVNEKELPQAPSEPVAHQADEHEANRLVPSPSAIGSEPEQGNLNIGSSHDDELVQVDSHATTTEVDAEVTGQQTEPEGSDGEAEAVRLLGETLGAEEVHPCSECGVEVTDIDLSELSQIRFRKYLCREHFKAAVG